MKYYPVAKPYITSDDINAVTEVLKSGNLSLGPKHKLFEKEFAQKIGVNYACSVSSGTAGLHLAMIAAGIGVGDEVITSPFSFVASANSILYVGAKPVFVDIDPITYNMDPECIESKITKKTKAILVVHIFGQSTDMDPILKLAKKYKLKIIEDACESLRAEYREIQAGTFGVAGVFAFYANKQMPTGEKPISDPAQGMANLNKPNGQYTRTNMGSGRSQQNNAMMSMMPGGMGGAQQPAMQGIT